MAARDGNWFQRRHQVGFDGKESKRPVDPILIDRGSCLLAGEFLVREAISDVTEEVAAFGFSLEELLVLISGEGEVAIDFAAVEAEVKNPAGATYAAAARSLDSIGSQFRLSVSFEIVPTIRKLWARFL